jgi:hypothetical protein
MIGPEVFMLLLAFPAVAQTFDVPYGRVVNPAANPLTLNGIGAPTVAWDPDDQLYVMFFETQTDTATTPPCRNGKWGIGAASSPDGITWTIWDDLVVPPTPSSQFACVAAHPAVVYDAGQFHLWFKAERGSNLPAAPAAAWDADNYTGVGYATVEVQLDDKTAEIAALDAQIAALEGDRDDAVLDYHAALVQYEADLLAEEDVFGCNVLGAPLCGECDRTRFRWTSVNPGRVVTRTTTMCQDFQFQVPSTLSVTLPGGYLGVASATLTWDGGSCTRTRFGFVLGTSSSYSCTTAPGTTVTTRSLTMTVSNVGLPAISSDNAINATNAQTYTGTVLTQLSILLTETGEPDPTTVSGLLGSWVSSLNTLYGWLDTPPVTTDEAFLRTETDAIRDDAVALQAELAALDAQIADLTADRDALLAYVPTVDATISPALALPLAQRFGYPSVAKLDGEWVMLLQQYPDLYRASGSTPDAFTLDPSPVLTAGTATWANSELYEPSMVCDSGPLPYTTWVAGKHVIASVLQTAGYSDAVSSDGVAWLLNTMADLTWTNNNSYRHFDVVSDTTGRLRMYSVQRVGNINEIHLAASDSTWGTPRNRVCVP